MNKHGNLALFLYGAEILCTGKIVKKKLGNPFKIHPNGDVEFHSTPSTSVTRSQPVMGATGITPEVARLQVESEQKKSTRRLDFEALAEDESDTGLSQVNAQIGSVATDTPGQSQTPERESILPNDR